MNLTVKAYNNLATVILRDSDGNVMGAKRGGGVFENVPVSKIGENNFFVTVISAKALAYLESDRMSISVDGQTDIQALLREGKYAEAIESTDSEYKTTYRVTLDYYTPNDAGINGIQIRTIGENSKVSNATLVNMGGDRGTAWMVTVPDQATSVQYTISLHNREQKLTRDGVKLSETGAYTTTANVTEEHFTVTAPDGVTKQDYTLYLVRVNAGVGSITVNGEAQKSTRGTFYYSALHGTKHIRVEATANDPRAMIQIGTDGVKTFASAIRDIDLNLTAMNTSVSIPVYVYTYPYDTVSSTSYLTVTRDAGRYSPDTVSFNGVKHQSDDANTNRLDEYGRLSFVLAQGITTGTLEVHTLSPKHSVALYDSNGVDIKYTSMVINEPTELSPGSRDYPVKHVG